MSYSRHFESVRFTSAAVGRTWEWAYLAALLLAGTSSLLGQLSNAPDGAGQQLGLRVAALSPNYALEWRIAGPYRWIPDHSTVGKSPRLDWVLSQPVSPAETQLTGGGSPKGVQWKDAENVNGIVNLQQIGETKLYQSAFAIAETDVPAETDVALMANADDGIQVWVNGELAVTKSEQRS